MKSDEIRHASANLLDLEEVTNVTNQPFQFLYKLGRTKN